MRIYYDTEFVEDGRTIELISIGMVAEDERELYRVSSEFDMERARAHPWIRDHVLPHIDEGGAERRLREDIANDVREFILTTPEPSLWAWYGAYDHVALCQLWGPMIELPKGVPMWTNDLKTLAMIYGNPPMPKQPAEEEHHALFDARHDKRIGELLFAIWPGDIEQVSRDYEL